MWQVPGSARALKRKEMVMVLDALDSSLRGENAGRSQRGGQVYENEGVGVGADSTAVWLWPN